MKIAHTNNNASFGEAFEASRNAGCEQFYWRGQCYHTRRFEEVTEKREPVILRIEERETA